MPFPNFHAARIKSPDIFIKESFVTKPIENGNINLILAKLKTDGLSGSLKTQAIRFKRTKFTVAEAKKWLADHDYKPILFEAATGKEADGERQYKTFPFTVTETKELQTDKGHFGIIKGYASTYGNLDRGGDIVLAGAFTKSLQRYRDSDRQIKMHFQHSRMDIIGGFPVVKIYEDDKGLFVEGEINLDVQRGREAYALAKQGVLSDMSIGYETIESEYNSHGEKLLKELELWEISIVGEPMNTEAVITSVKSAAQFKDLPLADRDAAWDKKAAVSRVRKFTNSEDDTSVTYKNAFMWYDKDNADNFTAYKLPYADVIDGQLKAVPRAIFAIAAVMRGARRGVAIPAEDRPKIISQVNKYYSTMGLESPLKGFYDNTIIHKDIDWISTKEDVDFLLEDFNVTININDGRKVNEEKLRNAGFSKKAANLLITVYRDGLGHPVQTEDKNSEVLRCLKQVNDLAEKLKILLKK